MQLNQFSYNFSFVMNVKQLIGGTLHNLPEGHKLRRATLEEITVIKEKMKGVHGGPTTAQTKLWENSIDEKKVRLSSEEWRYFVIEFEGGNKTMNELQDIFNITPTELEVCFDILGGGFALIYGQDQLFQTIKNAQQTSDFFVDVSGSDIDIINYFYELFKKHNNKLIDIREPLTQLRLLKGLPHNSILRFLGYFAILESLLTHPPDQKDPYDSITRQVKKKTALFNNRWSNKLDYSHFNGARHDKIWEKMYEYRSSLAHGGKPDFSKKLQILGNRDNALKLVKETVKSLIRQTLIEPQLMVDIKEC